VLIEFNTGALVYRCKMVIAKLLVVQDCLLSIIYVMFIKGEFISVIKFVIEGFEFILLMF